MEIQTGYKTELKLNNKQRTVCKQHAGVARFTYNFGLARKQEAVQQRKEAADPSTVKIPTARDLHKEIVELKHTPGKHWLAEVSKCTPQQALRDLDNAFQRFFKKQSKYPKLKKKGMHQDSFYLEGTIHTGTDWVQLPVVGKVALYEDNYIPGDTSKEATVLREPPTYSKNPNGKDKTAAERKQEREQWPIGTREFVHATVSRQGEHWFVSVLVREQVDPLLPATGEAVGIDLGIKEMAVCSNGCTAQNPKALRGRMKALKRAQKHLSRTLYKAGKAPTKKSRKQRKKKDRPYDPNRPRSERRLMQWVKATQKPAIFPVESPVLPGKPNQGKNRAKAKRTVAAIHKRIADIRKNALHQATSRITAKAKLSGERPKAIIIEDLNIKGMMQNHTLAQAIADVGMYEFTRQLAYKCEQQGITLYKAHPFYPSTQLCSGCHHMPTKHLDLSVRTYVCEHCGVVLDRDLNAAYNLRWLYTASPAEIDACGEFVSPHVLALVAVSKKQEWNTEADSAYVLSYLGRFPETVRINRENNRRNKAKHA